MCTRALAQRVAVKIWGGGSKIATRTAVVVFVSPWPLITRRHGKPHWRLGEEHRRSDDSGWSGGGAPLKWQTNWLRVFEVFIADTCLSRYFWATNIWRDKCIKLCWILDVFISSSQNLFSCSSQSEETLVTWIPKQKCNAVKKFVTCEEWPAKVWKFHPSCSSHYRMCLLDLYILRVIFTMFTEK